MRRLSSFSRMRSVWHLRDHIDGTTIELHGVRLERFCFMYIVVHYAIARTCGLFADWHRYFLWLLWLFGLVKSF